MLCGHRLLPSGELFFVLVRSCCARLFLILEERCRFWRGTSYPRFFRIHYYPWPWWDFEFFLHANLKALTFQPLAYLADAGTTAQPPERAGLRTKFPHDSPVSKVVKSIPVSFIVSMRVHRQKVDSVVKSFNAALRSALLL